MIILHVVGVCGLSSPWREWFLPLTPLNLMVSGYFVMRHAESPMKSILFYVLVLSWGVECLGVHTQFPFGEYAYGSALGPQLFEVPILIGLLWLLLLMGSLHLASRVSGNNIVRGWSTLEQLRRMVRYRTHPQFYSTDRQTLRKQQGSCGVLLYTSWILRVPKFTSLRWQHWSS